MLAKHAQVLEMPAPPALAERTKLGVQHTSQRSYLLTLGICLTSAILVVPCFWQRSLEAGDLSSHIYNAWLVQLIERGQAPGLSVANQSNNILFDQILSGLAHFVTLNLAARIGAAIAALVFFWGTFALAATFAKRWPWFLAPVIGIFAYGWTFNFGFFNYYLSIGLACIALAVFVQSKGWMRLVTVAFLPLVWLAHPLGFFWFIAAAAYVAIAHLVPRRLHVLLVFGAIVAIALVRIYVVRRFPAEFAAHSALFYSGLDQLLFTNRYELLVALVAAFLAASIVFQLRGHDGSFSAFLEASAVPLGLYLILEAAVQLLPDGIRLPQYAAPLSDLTERLTLISAILICCLFAAIKPRIWHYVASSAIALAFFAFLYQDTSRLSHTHAQIDALVQSLPPNQRVIFRVAQPLKYRFSFKHIIDEACIGRCFDYANYEPASKQFRVRASAANPFVLSNIHDASAVEAGTYVVQTRDLPLYEIYQCGTTWNDLCMRSLATGPLP